jgi:hypothetical protein
MLISAAFAPSNIVMLFAGAGLVLYIASRAAVDAVTSPANPSPGRMALAQWMPIAWCAVLAALTGHSSIAIGIVFASAIAGLALVLGVLVCIAPTTQIADVRTAAWAFIVPGGVLAFMAGFRGSVGPWHALMLLAAGVFVWRVWSGPREMNESSPPAVPIGGRAIVQLMLAILIGGLGAWLALKATLIADDRTRIATGGLLALAVLSPLLMLPVLGVGSGTVQNGHTGAAIGTLVGITLLNLFLLLPLITLSHYIHQIALAAMDGARTLTQIREMDLTPLPFPIAVWRVDTILLIVLGLVIAPVGLGRWTLHKIEGLALALIYAAYLIASTALVIRS